MSWLYSRALVEEYLAATCSDGTPFAPSSGNPTPQAYLPPDRMTAFSRPSRFGMTFEPLTDDHGAALLTWFLAASRARTSASPEKAPALTEPVQACGRTWRASWAKFDPVSSSWKTAQRCLLGDSEESSVTWPRSGMTAAGQCWELPTLEHPTSETGSGLWVPTPIATEWKAGCGKTGNRAPQKAAKAGMKLGEFAKLWPTPQARDFRSGDHPDSPRAQRKRAQGWSPNLNDVVLWPTPTSTLGTNGGRVTPTKAREGGTLIEALSARTMWATPTVCGNNNRAGASPKSGDGLATQAGGALNPTWVEWLMGWPLGWTDLKPLETDKSPFAPPQLGAC
jgi:hypothetical protein